jgi:hypothetical protein
VAILGTLQCSELATFYKHPPFLCFTQLVTNGRVATKVHSSLCVGSTDRCGSESNLLDGFLFCLDVKIGGMEPVIRE